MDDFLTYYKKVLNFFDGNEPKTLLWLTSANQAFGGMNPISMIILGRGHKVYEYIDTSLEENKRDD